MKHPLWKKKLAKPWLYWSNSCAEAQSKRK